MASSLVTSDYEDEEGLHFVLKDVHFSVANAIRRTILSNIPIVVIRTEDSKINQCTIHVNTTRFHNEIVKQRLSCIPICTKDITAFSQNYRLVLDVQNESSNELRWVTTDDFQIQHKQTEKFMDDIEKQKIFPHDVLSNKPIDFLRLRPSISQNIAGEHIKLSADFSIATASENGMFNVVSKISYHNVIDAEARENMWAIHLQTLKDESRTEKEIEFEKDNFMCLDAYRCFKVDDQGEANEFEFIVQSLGIYTNYEIVFQACDFLENKFNTFIQSVQSQIVPIHESIHSRDLGYTSVIVSTLDNSYDVILEKEDYTFGYLLEEYLFKLLFNEKEGSQIVFLGFKKYHPHDPYSVIRMAFKPNPSPSLLVKEYLIQASKEVAKTMNTLKNKFRK